MTGMKKHLIITAVISAALLFGCASTDSDLIGTPNPWTDCGDNLDAAEQTAGFPFALRLSNFTIHAMQGMIEIAYPLDEFRDVTVRKSYKTKETPDISGDYNDYPEKESTVLNKTTVTSRKNKDRVYVMYFSSEDFSYSARCTEGMTEKEAEGVFKVISETENL